MLSNKNMFYLKDKKLIFLGSIFLVAVLALFNFSKNKASGIQSPPSCHITISPSTIKKGEKFFYSWSSQNCQRLHYKCTGVLGDYFEMIGVGRTGDQPCSFDGTWSQEMNFVGKGTCTATVYDQNGNLANCSASLKVVPRETKPYISCISNSCATFAKNVVSFEWNVNTYGKNIDDFELDIKENNSSWRTLLTGATNKNCFEDCYCPLNHDIIYGPQCYNHFGHYVPSRGELVYIHWDIPKGSGEHLYFWFKYGGKEKTSYKFRARIKTEGGWSDWAECENTWCRASSPSPSPSPSPGPSPSKTCSDNTPYGQCSSKKPKYCDNGNLVDRCKICGCPSGYDCLDDGTCAIKVSPSKCIGDINNDGEVNIYDLAILMAHWGQKNTADLNNDNIVDLEDMKILLKHWGETCENQCQVQGDIDNNREINCEDLDCILGVVLGEKNLKECPCSDVNTDGKVNQLDVSKEIDILLSKGIECGKCRQCSDCGKGIFNVCDRQECLSCQENCYFINKIIGGDCLSCSNANSCQDYKDDKDTCQADPCNFGNCEWEDGKCVSE